MQTFTGKEYLQIDIASHFGDDKKEGFLGDKDQFENRIAWVERHEHELEKLEDDADDMFRYAAAVMAYRKAQKGIPTGHMVGLDACASGPAILSCLTGCTTGALNTGAIGDKRQDVYGSVTNVMEDLLQELMEYSRTEVKYSFMPHFYGSTAEPKKIFGEDTTELYTFYEATDQTCPGANRILPVVQALWNPDAYHYDWDYPDGFHVHYKVKTKVDDVIEVDTLPKHPTFTYRHTVNEPLESGKFLISGITHGADGYMVREITARCDHNKAKLRSVVLHLVQRLKKDILVAPEQYLYIEKMWRKHECLSIEGAEFVTAWSVNQMSEEYCKALLALVRETLKRPSHKIVTVHDEYEALANYMNNVRQTYIDVLAEIADSNMLNAMLTDIAGYPMHIEKLSEGLGDQVRQAEYPLA